MDCVISESCNKGTLLLRNHTKINISWSFSYRVLHESHVLLNLLTGWGKEIKCEACRAFYLFFATN